MKTFTITAVMASMLTFGMSSAQAEEVPILKNAAIVGGLASLAYAYMNRDSFEECTLDKRATLQTGVDEEVKSTSVAVSIADCKLKASARPLGVNFNVAPTFMVSEWTTTGGAGASTVTEITFIPKVQYVVPYKSVRFDATFGIGVSLISATSVGDRVKSTNFQFSDEIGVGISDSTDRLRVGLVYRHLSNLGIALPNNGVDFRGITLTYKF